MRLPLSALLTLPIAGARLRAAARLLRKCCRSPRSSHAAHRTAVAAGLAFDLETTGLDTRSAEIVQFAIVVANSQRGAKFSRLVLPEGDIDRWRRRCAWVRHSEVLLDRGARPFAEVWEECEGWLRETLGETRPLVWAAHNGDAFDKPILSRCVRELGGGTSALLSSPRAAFVDTLQLARRALPKRRHSMPYKPGRPGPYTLGSLYQSAMPDGASLEGAHDALVDAEALAAVWKWLIAEQGADKLSTQWPSQQQEEARESLPDLPPFQAHLQYYGYPELQAAQAKRALAQMKRVQGSTQQAKGKAASRAVKYSLYDDPYVGKENEDAGGVVVEGDGSLMRVPGVGPALAKRFTNKGIATYEDLYAVWVEREGDSKKMTGWMLKSMPGINRLTLARAVKGMASEFAARG